MDDQDVMTLLSSEVRAAGSQAAWAREHGIAPAYLSQVLTGRRPPGPSLLAALGLSRRIVIEGAPIQGRTRDPEILNTPSGHAIMRPTCSHS